MICVFCSRAIESVRGAYRKVAGWEKFRPAGGTNALRLREPSDEWACAACIDRQGHGVSVEQGSLL